MPSDASPRPPSRSRRALGRPGLLVAGAALMLSGCAGAAGSLVGSTTGGLQLSGATAAGRSHPVTDRPHPGPHHATTKPAIHSASQAQVSSPPPSTTTTTTPPVSTPPPNHLAGAVTVVGDSVMVDATPYLEADIKGVYIDAQVGRAWQTGEGVFSSLVSSHSLGPVAVVGLGLNGPIGDGDVEAMMSILAHEKRVIFLTIHLPMGAYCGGSTSCDYWQNSNNSVLAQMVPKYHNAVLADWYSYSEPHPDWFYSDGIHLDGAGSAAMAAFIARFA